MSSGLHPLLGAGALAVAMSVYSSRLAPPSQCVPPNIDTSAWRQDSGSVFTLRLPRAYGPRYANGIDSEVWVWYGRRGELLADYGVYSGPYTPWPHGSAIEECTARIGADTVRFATFYRPDYGFVVHAWWANTPPTNVLGQQFPTSLMLIGTAADSATREELRGVMFTVRVAH